MCAIYSELNCREKLCGTLAVRFDRGVSANMSQVSLLSVHRGVGFKTAESSHSLKNQALDSLEIIICRNQPISRKKMLTVVRMSEDIRVR